MSNAYDSWRTGIQIDNIYPIGSIYMSVNSTNPGTLFGGTWQAIENTFLVAQGSSFTAGSTGGQKDYVAADMPSHSHTRGTMEISGELKHNATYSGTPYSSGCAAGAFGSLAISGQQYYLNGRATGSGWIDVNFYASRTWTGETSVSGTNTAAEILPPYLAVYMWKRIA